MSSILIASVAVMLASLIGVISVWRTVGTLLERNLRFLVSFSAGVFLIVSLQLAGEALEHSASATTGVAWILVGLVGILLFFRFLPAFHHHHDTSQVEAPHSRLDARRILLGDAIHNIGDGVLITISFLANPALGVVTTLGIFIHELVQEISEFFVLRQAGYETKKALGINFLVSATILIGAVGTFFLIDTFESLEIPLLGIAAGSFFVVVLYDLIPHSVRSSKTKTQHLYHLVAFILGAVIMLAVVGAFADSHTHGEGGHHGHDDHDHGGELHDDEHHMREDEHEHHDEHDHDH